MEQEYFDRWVAYRQGRIGEMEAKIAASSAPPANKARYRFSIFREHYQLLLLRYSQGEEVAALAGFFPRVVESFERFEPADGGPRLDFGESLDDYVTALWLVSLALLFGADDGLFGRLLALVGNDGRDELYERLVAARAPGRAEARGLLYPRPYELLLGAASAPPGRREDLVAEFLRAWYPSLKDAYWHESHRGPDGGGFYGYWAVEAAGAARAFGADDAPFREMPHYPKDLAGFRR